MQSLRFFGRGNKGVGLGLVCLLVVEIMGVSLLTILLLPTQTTAAVVTIDTTTSSDARSNNNTGAQTVFVSDQVGYTFYRDSTGQCVYSKTTDAGGSWGSSVLVDSQTDCVRILVWYDRWTPGNTGDAIHVMTIDTSEDDLFYNRLDTTNDTLQLGAAPVNASSNSGQSPTLSSSVNLHTMTVATDGTVYAAINDNPVGSNSVSYAVSCSSSCELETSWTEVGVNPFDNRSDYNILMPLAGGDVLVINRDVSANVIRSKTWNGSAWSAAWTVINTNVTESSEYDGAMSATIDQSTGHVYLAYATDNSSLDDDDDDIQTAVYDGSAWTNMTNVFTDIAGRGLLDVSIAIDQNNGDVYVAYTIQDTGGVNNSANIYYRESTDGMTTWGSEVGPINATAGNIRKPALDPSNFERLYVTWFESSTRDRFGETLDNIGPDTNVSTLGSQVEAIRAGTDNFYIGGTLVLESLVTNTLSALVVHETGAVDAQTGLNNIALFYDLDTTAPYDCVDEVYSGAEPQFGSTITTGFDAPNGRVTFTGSALSLTPTRTFCGYIVLDVTEQALDATTIGIEITDPVNDVVITGTDPFPDAVVSITGFTDIVSSELTQTHYHWRNDDGSETAATSRTGGVEDARLPALRKFVPQRLRLGVSVEGSTSTNPIAYQLEYAEAASVCSDVTSGWVAVGAAVDSFAMSDSVHIVDGANTTNIPLSVGGVTDENTIFKTPNAALKDTSDTTASITLERDEFLELEFSIVAEAAAVEGTTYCFRLTAAGAPIGVYSEYPRVTINADITARVQGAQLPTIDIPTEEVYLGGVITLQANDSSNTVTAVTITENGTIDASAGLQNVSLFYDLDTSLPLDCAGESYDGSELQFGATDADGFGGANGSSTFTGSVLVSTTQSACLYVVVDVTEEAQSGDTIQFGITSAVTDVVAGASSISPSAPIAISGSTTALGAVLTQTDYHWRADDGSQTAANSLTNGSESTPATNFQINTPVRLRMGISNNGATTSRDTVYSLQFSERVSTCSAVSVWTPVSETATDAWDEFDSTFLTHGEDTTNIPVSAGGLTDPNSTFVGTNAVRESTAQSPTVQLTQAQFLELEFSLTATLATAYGASYCFRVVANGEPLAVYDEYPQLSVAARRDFRTQRGTVIISGGTTNTITAGVDYDAPLADNRAFIRITNTNNTGAGDINGGGSQDVEEVTAYIQNPNNLDTSVTFARERNLNETYIDWEIVEFIGRTGTDNEMTVHAADTVSMSTVETTATGLAVSVTEAEAVVVFITGVSGDDTGDDFYATQVTAEWDETNNQPIFTRGDTGASGANISYAVVEFTGRNWLVQRAEHTYTAAGVTQTQTITPVTAITQAFVHAQKRLGAQERVGSHGHEVFLSSIGVVSFALSADANISVPHTSVAWVIENIQTGVGAMQVERQSGVTRSGAEPLTLSVAITNPLAAVDNASIFGSSAASGNNNAHPRSIAGLKITTPTTYTVWRSDTGTDLFYRAEIVQWPIANLAYRQNYYRFYADNNQLTPNDAWPAGSSDLGENTSITAFDDPPGIGDVLRLRMTIQARNANWPAEFAQFKLQFAERATTCTAIDTWSDVGSNSSSTIWRGFAATGTTDGSDLSSDPSTPGDLLLSVADVAGVLAHENNSATNTHLAFDGEDVEFDWYISHNGATADTPYCFRMVEASGTALSGYLQYPELRTADFTPVIKDWRWYADPENETPVSPLTAVNSAPADITASSTLALRVVVPEVKSVAAEDVKFQLQFSQDATFATFSDVVASTSCTLASTWCYVDGGAPDNATITSAIIGSSDTCVGGAGAGCGTQNSSGTFAPGHKHDANEAQEYSFTIKSTLLRPSAVYYFRLYDVGRARAVALGESAVLPSAVGEGANLVFTVAGVPNGTTTAGQLTAATTSATAVDFGSLPVGTDVTAAQRISVDTNAIEGYRVWKFARQNLTNSSGLEIPPVNSTNQTPASWTTGCLVSATGCVGYHTTDATLGGGSARFAPQDTYAAFATQPVEIMYSSLPTVESHDVVYRVSVTEAQPAGLYETNIVYIAAPVF